MTVLHSPSGTGDGEIRLTYSPNTDAELAAARRAVLRQMDRGVLTAADTLDLIEMLGLADDLALPEPPATPVKPARSRSGAKQSLFCRAGLHDKTPENTGHGGRCLPCRRAKELPDGPSGDTRPRNSKGHFLGSAA